MYERIAAHIDKIAESLESKGMLREAEELDMISNTLEAAQGGRYGIVREMPGGGVTQYLTEQGFGQEMLVRTYNTPVLVWDTEEDAKNALSDYKEEGWAYKVVPIPSYMRVKKKWINRAGAEEDPQNKKQTVAVGFAKRQMDPNFVGTKVTPIQMEKLRKEAERQANANILKPGNGPHVKIAVVKDPQIMCPIAEITPQNEHLLKTQMVKRREGEGEYEQRYFESKDVAPTPSDHVKVILYSGDQIAKERAAKPDAEAPTGADWEIVSVNAEPTPAGTPMAPSTMQRNREGPASGGSGLQHSDEEMAAGKAYWDTHAKIL